MKKSHVQGRTIHLKTARQRAAYNKQQRQYDAKCG